jgi:hypothetical protein
MSHKEQIIIGIDPDVDRNGIAMLDMSTHSLQVQMLAFPNLLDFIKEKYRQFAEIDKWDFKVIIEAGWMNHGNYHIKRWQGIASLGVDQGRNEQVSRTIGQMMEHWGIPYEFKRPLPKCWNGKDRKITKEELEEITLQKLGRLNQEGRDAALLAWDYAGLPMRITSATLRGLPSPKNPVFFTEIGTICVIFCPKVITI